MAASAAALPTVTSLTPTAGPVAGGTVVTINGTNLTGASKVLFGTTAGTAVTVVSSTQVKATAPAHVAGAVDVRVTTPGGTTAIVTADRFTYASPPTLTSLTPTAGPVAGGTVVTINGTNLTGASKVLFGTTAGTAVTMVSSTQVKATAPAHVAGAVDVRVTTPGGTTAIVTADRFTYASPPTLTSLTPTAGPIAGGTVVTINGTNLTGASKVLFGTTAGTAVTMVSSTQVKATAPAHVAGAVDVRVTTPGGTTAIVTADRFTYASPPTLSSLIPTSGSTGGGTVVTITGTNLTGASKVLFGTTTGTAISVVSATQVRVTSPAHAAGTVDVQVITPGGTSAVVTTDKFTFVTPPAPTITAVSPTGGPTGGGTVVTLTGTNLSQASGVTFGGIAGTTLTSVSATQVKVTTPAHAAGTVDVLITTPGGSSLVSTAAKFTYAAAPTVTAISPTGGPLAGGTVVTVTGTNLSGTSTVTFGGIAGTALTVLSATQVKVTAPAHAAGAVDVIVTTPGGVSAVASTAKFSFFAAPTVTAISPTSGSTGGGTFVTITGTNLTGATTVRFGTTAGTGLTVTSSTQVTVVSPAHSAGVVDVTVTTPGGSSAAVAADAFTFVTPAPTVTALSPGSGPIVGGTVVTVTGANLTGATAVTFGGTAGTAVAVVSPTQVTVTAPAMPAGTVDVRVTTSGGTSAATAGSKYTYAAAPTLTAVSPSAGPVTGGAVVTVTGTNLLGATKVAFGGTPGTGLSIVSATQVKVTSPALAAATVDVVVTTPGGTSGPVSGSKYTFAALPTVTSLSPSAGGTTGGTVVTVTGTNLTGASAVLFGGTAGSALTVVSATQVKITSPAHAAGTVDVQVTTPGGTSPTSSADAFTYSASATPPTVTSVAPAAGSTAGGTVVVISGTNFTGATRVSFGGTGGTALAVDSATQLTVTSPAHAAGTVDVQVTTASGTSATVTADRFIYTVSHCGTISANETWNAVSADVLTCQVTVAAGATLTLAPGSVVKAASGGGLSVLGTLSASGTSAAPITLTDARDDSVRGDTNGDGAGSGPAPGGWNGVDAQSTDPLQPSSISLDHVIVRYASVRVSSVGDDRDSTNYVTRTASITNSKFEHGSSLVVAAAGPTTITGNTVNNAADEQTVQGIAVTQSAFLASTTVTENTVSGVQWATANDQSYCSTGPAYAPCGVGVAVIVRSENSVGPVVSGNAVSNTNHEAWWVSSSQLDPAKLSGNTGAASSLQGFALEGTLTHNLSLPFGTLPLVLGNDGLVVGEGTTLQIAAGTTVKSRGGALQIAGTLNAPGTSTAAISFTSWRDDSIGGDYNGDGSVSAPNAGDWGGIRAGSDSAVSPSVVNLSYATVSYGNVAAAAQTVASPASLTIDHLALSYGSLTDYTIGDDRDDNNYVGRTTSVTNSTFRHGSSISINSAGPITVTGNSVVNTGAEQTPQGISVTQSAYLAATTVSGNTVSGVASGTPDNNGNCGAPSYSPCGTGLGVSVVPDNSVAPIVTNNAISSTNHEAWWVSSSQLDSAKLTGNTGASTSLQGFMLEGTLTHNLTLPFGTLPLVIGTGSLTVGEGTTLQIAPGTVLKSRGGGLYAIGAIKAPGTIASPISFTSWRDDSIGGDYNKDGTVTTPTAYDWQGIPVGTYSSSTPSSVAFTYVNMSYGTIAAYAQNPLAPASISIDHLSMNYGKLSDYTIGDDRDTNNYVARVTSITNSSFKHGSSVEVSSAGPITVSGNTVSNLSTEQAIHGISVTQTSYLAATTVTGNTVSGVAYGTPDNNGVCGCGPWATPYGIGLGVDVNDANSVSPIVTNNTISNTNHEAWWASSSQLNPTKLTGNTAAASSQQGFILEGALVQNLSLPFGSLPLVLGTGMLTVSEGVTLQVAAGTILKSRGGSLNVQGTVNAPGTSASVISFTSWRDDSIGGDYNKDGTVTTPTAGDWGGISTGGSAGTTRSAVNLTYVNVSFGDIRGYAPLSEAPTSMSVDHMNLSYGRLSDYTVGDDLNDPNYVPRATTVTNSTFRHGSSISVSSVGPIVVTGNTISNAGAEQNPQGIAVAQGGSNSTTTVNSNAVSGATWDVPDNWSNSCGFWPSPLPCGIGIAVSVNPQSPVSPTVSNNSISNSNHEAWYVSSGALDPSKLTGNTAAATTVQGFILDGTLTHDLTLPFGGLPLTLGGGLTVGEGTALTVGAGTLVKSRGGGLTINGVMTAPGSGTSAVTFTSYRDDTIGGDYNKDGSVTTPTRGGWNGISTDSGGVTTISGGVIRYAGTALWLGQGDVSYRGKLTLNYQGAGGNQCDPNTGSNYIDARNVDWGTPTGPAPYGSGDRVNECVIVQPWVGQTNFRARYWGGSSPSGGWAGSAYGSYGYTHGYGGDPVDVATGNLSMALTDITVPEPGPDLVVARAYNSQSDLTGSLGPKWTYSWDTHLTLPGASPTGTYDVHWGDGRIDPYAVGTFAAQPGNFTILSSPNTFSYVAVTKQRVKYTFSASGALQSVVDPNGNTLTVTTDAQGRVTSVQDAAARTLSMTYTGINLTKITDPAGKTVSYAYSPAGDLISVTDQTGAVVKYGYDSDHQLLTATDALNNVTLSNMYDVNGRVVRQTDAAGGTTRFDYSPDGGTTFETDPRGYQRRYTYDTPGQVLTSTDGAGATTTNVYTSAGLLFSTTDPLGRITRYSYDSHGNRLTTVDPLKKTTTYTYNSSDLPIQMTDPAGGTSGWTYDSNGNLTASTDPRGSTTTYAVNSRGLRISATDPLGKITTYGYDSAGNLLQTTDPLAHTTASTYDLLGRPLTKTDALGKATTFTYDARGAVLTVTDPLGKKVSTSYDAAGHRVKVTDALGNVTLSVYGPTDLLTKVTDPTGAITELGYDANGNLTSSTDPTGSVTGFGYDSANRQVSVTDAIGNTSQTAYDAAGQVISTTDPLDNTETKTYDADGNMSAVTDALNVKTSFTYDWAGRQLTVKDAKSHIWATSYDAAGNPTSRTDPLSRTTSNTYDAAGRLASVTDAAGGVTTFTYDAAGRRTGATYPGGTAASYGYDANGSLTTQTDPTGTLTQSYDADGRMTSATDGIGQVVSYTYDAGGRVASRSQPGSVTTTFGYDAAGRMTSATDPAGNASWTYDASGAPTGAVLPNGVTAAFTTDATHRLTDMNYTKSATVLFTESMTYDAAGRITGVTDPTGKHTYGYDKNGQLTSDTVGASTTGWTYDGVGNRTSQTGTAPATYTYDAADQLVTAGSATYTYDAKGNLTKTVSPAGTTTYSWDSHNQLIGMTTPSGTTNYVVDDSGVMLKQTGLTTANYVTDRTSGQILARGATRTLTGIQPYGTVSGTISQSLLLDHLGSVRDTVTAAGVATSYDYGPFGVSVGTAPTAANPGFVGGLTQPDSSIRFGARSLDPMTGRWTSLDPTGLRENDQRYSAYNYVQNDPSLRSDVTGRSSRLWDAFGTAVGIANSVVQAVSGTAQSAGATILKWTDRGINAIDIGRSLYGLGSVLFGAGGTPNRSTGSYNSRRTRDISGAVSAGAMVGSIDRLNDVVNNMDYSDLGGNSGEVSCVSHLYSNGLTGLAKAAVDGSEFSSSAYINPKDAAFSSGIDFFTDLISTSNNMKSC